MKSKSMTAPSPRSGSWDPASEDFSYRTYPFHLLSLASGRYNAAMERALRAVGMDQPTVQDSSILN
jgi:hypothetical protein